MEQIIYDRTQADVDYARLNPDSKEYLKGTLNYVDLNRIERNYLELQEKLALIGKDTEINPVKTFVTLLYSEMTQNYDYYENMTYEELLNEDKWIMTDFIFIEYINQIRRNVEEIKKAINSNEPIEYTSSLNYKQLNSLEKILYEATIFVQNQMKSFQYAGTFYCGEEMVAY